MSGCGTGSGGGGIISPYLPAAGALGNVAVSGSPSAGQVLVAAGSTAAGWQNGNALDSWGPNDQGYLAWNYDLPASTPGAAAALATPGTMYVMALKVIAPVSVTNLVIGIQTNGATLTTGQNFGALYQAAGGTLIGQTSDQSAAWVTGSTRISAMALAGGPFALAAGIVYAGLWFNGTTGPSPARTSLTLPYINAGLASAASRWGTANTGLTTTAPSTLGTITSAGAIAAYWAALS